VARIGTAKHPAIARVRSAEHAQRIIELCSESGVHAIVGVEPDKPKDISDIERAFGWRGPMRALPKPGRNDPCPCGSGRKAKKCCPELTI